MQRQWLTVFMLVPLFACTAAHADTTLVFDQTGAGGGAAHKQPIYISKGRIRFDGGLPDSYVLFDAQTRTVTRVNTQQHTYVRINEETLDSIASAVTSAEAQAMAQIKNLPPDQQQKMRAMMKGMGPDGGQRVEPVREVPSSETRTVSGRKCRVAASYRGSQKVAELCVVSPKRLRMSAQDFATLRAFQKFTMRMARKFPAGAHELELGDPERRYIPVEVTQLGSGGQRRVTRLTSVSHAAIPASRFEVPNGYKQQQVMQSIKAR